MEEASDARRAVIFWAVAAGFAVAAVLLVAAPQALLLTFAGVLLGTSLRGLAEYVARLLHCSVKVGLAVTVAVLVLAAVGATSWVIPRVGEQVVDLRGEVGSALGVAREQLAARGFDLPGVDSQAIAGYARHAAGILATGVGLAGGALFVAFLALYIAVAPNTYRRGVLALVPGRHRATADAVLGAIASTLRRWMAGRLISMVAVGVLTTVGLWLLGVPLPVTLGAFAALLDFVPNVGPLVSAVPALVLAAPMGLESVLLVGALYLAINIADGYLLTPWLQKRAVSTPPAAVLVGQLLFGALFGVLGVMVATPLVASLLVAFRTVRPAAGDA